MRGKRRTGLEDRSIAAVYGPWHKPQRGIWALTLVLDCGTRSSAAYPTEAEAVRARDEWRRLHESRASCSIETALIAYETWRVTAGRKQRSTHVTLQRLRTFFDPTDRLFLEIAPAWAQARYADLVSRLAVDTHRNSLAGARTFVRWSSERRLCEAGLLDSVRPVGKRKHGKPQLRIDELRAWLRTALRRAHEPGVTAALMTVTMGLRAGEIVQRVVRDVDDEGRVLWITDDADGQSLKTVAARRRVDIPDLLRPNIQNLLEGRAPSDWIFSGGRKSKSGHIWTGQVRRSVHEICDEAGVPRVCAHGMRGAYATLGALGQMRELAASLGHESESTTRQSYVAPEALQRAAQQNVLRVLRGGK